MAEGNKQSPFNSTNEEHLGAQQSVSSNNNAQDKKKNASQSLRANGRQINLTLH